MFSIVIPLYNKELSIKNTIQSVINQTCQDFEIIVVNDGSTDDSAKIIESIDDYRIRLICQKNQGVSAARNSGIKEAKREWIALLDGDDLWEANHLEEIKKMMDVFPNEKVYVTSFEYSDGRKMFKHPRKNPIFKIENYFKEAIKESLVCSSIVVINNSCFEEIEGFNEKLKYGEDLELWARLAQNFQIIKSGKTTAVYRVDAENRSETNQKLEHCLEFHVDLRLANNDYIRDYYYYLINRRLYSYLRTLKFKNFFKLVSLQRKTKFKKFIITKFAYNFKLKK